MLANGAEVREGLGYVLGGGWTRCWPNSDQQYPLHRPISFFVSIRVDYGETNQEHRFHLSVVDSDEQPLQDALDGGFTVGRDATLTPGMSQVVQVAGTIGVTLPSPGIYFLALHLNGAQAHRVGFEALEQPLPG